MDIKEVKRFIQVELDRLGPCVKDELSAIEVKTLERILWFINGGLCLEQGQIEYSAFEHANSVAKEVNRIRERWLLSLGIAEHNKHYCKIVQFERKEGRLVIFHLYKNDLPQYELIIDLETGGTTKSQLGFNLPATNQPPAESR